MDLIYLSHRYGTTSMVRKAEFLLRYKLLLLYSVLLQMK